MKMCGEENSFPWQSRPRVASWGLLVLMCAVSSSCKSTRGASSAKAVGPLDLASPKDWAGQMGMFLDDSAESGARVVKVQDFSFAQVTGIREGDIIVAVNGREFQRAGGFERELASLQGIISKPWSFQIIRMGGTLFLEPPYKCHPPVLTACGPVPIEMDK